MRAKSVITPDYTPHARAERLIAAGRFVLAFFSLVAVYLEPSTPAKFQQTTYALLAVYTAYALVIVGVAWRRPVPSRRWRLASHALDLLLFSIFIVLTEGPASPFFLYFVFSLFCATLRFTWRGILATAVAAVTIYGAMSLVASMTEPAFEISRPLIRQAYLTVIAALLVYLAIHQQRLRIELASLAAWPRELGSRVEDLLGQTLAHAAGVLRAERVLLFWEETEEPWVYAASWTRDEFRVDRFPPAELEPVGGAALHNRSFFTRADSELLQVYDPSTSAVTEERGAPLGPRLRARCGIDSAIAVSLASETLEAQLVVPGVRTATADDLALAHIAGRLVLGTLEQFFFVQQVRQAASAEERLRISRELHDGIVQSLGGVGLQLQAIRRQLPESLSDEAARLAHVQKVIEQDQRELRTIVRELRPHDTRDGGAIVLDALQRMRERFPLEWGLEVDVECANLDVPPRLAHELCRIVNESLSNAARHGGATRAAVTLTTGAGEALLRVRDNGRGFPFTGRYDLAALERSGHGPRTLKERVITLGGSLSIESNGSGATIEATVPLAQEAFR